MSASDAPYPRPCFYPLAIPTRPNVGWWPVFGALSFLAAAPEGEQIGFDFNSRSKLYLGLAVGSLACWWIGSFVESAQVKNVAEAFNRKGKVSLQVDPDAKGIGLAYRMGY
jgi:hypothetical protein